MQTISFLVKVVVIALLIATVLRDPPTGASPGAQPPRPASPPLDRFHARMAERLAADLPRRLAPDAELVAVIHRPGRILLEYRIPEAALREPGRTFGPVRAACADRWLGHALATGARGWEIHRPDGRRTAVLRRLPADLCPRHGAMRTEAPGDRRHPSL